MAGRTPQFDWLELELEQPPDPLDVEEPEWLAMRAARLPDSGGGVRPLADFIKLPPAPVAAKSCEITPFPTPSPVPSKLSRDRFPDRHKRRRKRASA